MFISMLVRLSRSSSFQRVSSAVGTSFGSRSSCRTRRSDKREGRAEASREGGRRQSSATSRAKQGGAAGLRCSFGRHRRAAATDHFLLESRGEKGFRGCRTGSGGLGGSPFARSYQRLHSRASCPGHIRELLEGMCSGIKSSGDASVDLVGLLWALPERRSREQRASSCHLVRLPPAMEVG